MNPNDLLFLIVPTALVTFKLSLLALAVVLITRSVFKVTPGLTTPLGPMNVPARNQDTLA
jgi:hypothetical protein